MVELEQVVHKHFEELRTRPLSILVNDDVFYLSMWFFTRGVFLLNGLLKNTATHLESLKSRDSSFYVHSAGRPIKEYE